MRGSIVKITADGPEYSDAAMHTIQADAADCDYLSARPSTTRQARAMFSVEQMAYSGARVPV